MRLVEIDPRPSAVASASKVSKPKKALPTPLISCFRVAKDKAPESAPEVVEKPATKKAVAKAAPKTVKKPAAKGAVDVTNGPISAKKDAAAPKKGKVVKGGLVLKKASGAKNTVVGKKAAIEKVQCDIKRKPGRPKKVARVEQGETLPAAVQPEHGVKDTVEPDFIAWDCEPPESEGGDVEPHSESGSVIECYGSSPGPSPEPSPEPSKPAKGNGKAKKTTTKATAFDCDDSEGGPELSRELLGHSDLDSDIMCYGDGLEPIAGPSKLAKGKGKGKAKKTPKKVAETDEDDLEREGLELEREMLEVERELQETERELLGHSDCC